MRRGGEHESCFQVWFGFPRKQGDCLAGDKVKFQNVFMWKIYRYSYEAPAPFTPWEGGNMPLESYFFVYILSVIYWYDSLSPK